LISLLANVASETDPFGRRSLLGKVRESVLRRMFDQEKAGFRGLPGETHQVSSAFSFLFFKELDHVQYLVSSKSSPASRFSSQETGYGVVNQQLKKWNVAKSENVS
jgi:hypothetical protein